MCEEGPPANQMHTCSITDVVNTTIALGISTGIIIIIIITSDFF